MMSYGRFGRSGLQVWRSPAIESKFVILRTMLIQQLGVANGTFSAGGQVLCLPPALQTAVWPSGTSIKHGMCDGSRMDEVFSTENPDH